jgi:hypothetical protein
MQLGGCWGAEVPHAEGHQKRRAGCGGNASLGYDIRCSTILLYISMFYLIIAYWLDLLSMKSMNTMLTCSIW